MRKEKFWIYISMFGALIALQGLSCEKNEDELYNFEQVSAENLSEVANFSGLTKKGEGDKVAYTVLGRKRNNPFSLTSVNEAKRNLYGASSGALSATHTYVKFMPANQEDLAELTEWEIKTSVPLFDFPLDYEVISMGEAYVDPAVSDSLFTYQYASVPVGMEMPEVSSIALEDLYLDRTDPLLLAESFRLRDYADRVATDLVGLQGIRIEDLGGAPQALIPEPDCPPGCLAVLFIDTSTIPSTWTWTCDCNPPPPPPTALNDCGCTVPSNFRNPAGCVQVADDAGGMIPVQDVQIKVKDDWFTSDITYTNTSGCWQVNENYHNNMWMWVRFENGYVKIRDGRYWLGIKVVGDYAGRFNAPPYNNITVGYESGAADNTSNERMYWAAAHTINTVSDYRTRAATAGIPLPREGLNWYNRQGDAPAGAPMLQDNVFSSWPSYFAAILLPVPYVVASYTILPDVVNRYEENETTANFNGTGYHELGHTSHYRVVGEGYWVGYRNHIINNSGYGAFEDFAAIGSDPGKVALGEALGNYAGAIFGNTAAGGEGSAWEDNFIPRGLMFDLIDNSPAEVVTDPNNPTISGFDNISGFTSAMIFSSLQPNVENVRQFRNRLRTLHLGSTPNTADAYNTFVDIYDVFN